MAAPAVFSLKHLNAVLSVAECGSVAEASRRLNRSPSTIARSIKLIDETYGCDMFARYHGELQPTPEGRRVLARAAFIRRDLQALAERTGSGQSPIRAMELDASRLRSLVAVYDHGSAKRAGSVLGVSQPAISSAIRQMEADVGDTLFERTPTGMVPTSKGHIAYTTAKRVLNELRQIEEEVASAKGTPAGLVRIAGLAYSRSWLLPEAIAQTISRYPDIVVRTIEGPIDTLINAVHSGDIDAIICARPNASRLEGLSVEELVFDRMKLFVNAAHPLASEKEIDARRVLDFPFILPPGRSATRDALDTAFLEATGRKPSGTVETSSYAVIKRLLLASQHISFRSVKEFREDVDAGVIKSLDLGFEFDDRAICILQRSSAIQTPATSEVLNLIRSAARDAREFG